MTAARDAASVATVPRLRRSLLRLLAVLMLLQSGVAVAHGLRAMGAAAPWLVEICTSEGRRTVALGEDGQPAPEQGPQGEGFCPACHALPEVVLPTPPMLATPVHYSAGPHQHPGKPPAERPRQRAPPQNPRAPPTSG